MSKKISGEFAPLLQELGEDERFITKSTDLDKLLYVLIIFTCHMTNHAAPTDPRFYKIRYGLRSKTGQIAASMRRLQVMYPMLSWADGKLSLLKSATYKIQVDTEVEREGEKNKKENKDEPPTAHPIETLIKKTSKKMEESLTREENPKLVNLKDVHVKCGSQELSEASKHKIHNKLIKTFQVRGWNPMFIKSVMVTCAGRLEEKSLQGELYPYYERTVARFINENSETLSAQNKPKQRVAA
jgi:hypothetical protein